MEAKCVEATDVGKKVVEEEPKVATEELSCDTPAVSLETTGKHIDSLWFIHSEGKHFVCFRMGIFTVIIVHSLIFNPGVAETEDGSSAQHADEKKADKAGDPVSPPSQDQAAETAEPQPGDIEPEPPVSQQDPEKMEVEKEENEGKETISLEERESVSAELINNDSGLPTTESLCEDPQKSRSPSPSPSVDDKECQSAADDSKSQPSPCLDHRSSSPLSLTADTQEVLSAEDGGVRLLPQSEEEEEDEQVKAEEHAAAIKQELQERKVKEELLLDELSNMSHGDESSSGFMGSPGEADAQLSMELGLEPTGRSHGDNLLTETDDSLPFEPMRGDRDKVKRRGSPGRSRVKQVRSVLAGVIFHFYNIQLCFIAYLPPAFSAEVIAFLGGVDLEAVVQGEGVAAGRVLKPWPPASMPFW